MRGRWDHEAPEGHQPLPLNNTSRYIYAQVSRWLRTHEPLHPEVAMEIAAWWHGPGRQDTAITAFASHGDVKIHGVGGWRCDAGYGPDLDDTIRDLIARRAPRHPGESRDYVAMTTCLRALESYVDDVVEHATRWRRSPWHGGGHWWMGTGEVDRGSCRTCGALADLRPEVDSDGDYGCYYGGDGELIIECTGRTDLVHGGERLCEGATGAGCDAWRESGGETCGHVDHVCNCLLCHN